MAQTQALNEGPSNSGWRSGRKIGRVRGVLLREERNHHDYIPKEVSIGPYHHGNPELGFAESIKSSALEVVLDVAGQKDICLQVIKKEITEIRNCYEEGSTDRYDDDELARMMLLDASFIMVHMVAMAGPCFKLDNGEYLTPWPEFVNLIINLLSPLSMSIALRDMCLVENQIPFWIVRHLLSTYAPGNEQKLLDRYLTVFLFGKFYSAKRTPPADEYGEALHLLEHFYRALAVDYHEPKETYSSHVNCCFSVKERTNADLESGECHQGVSRSLSCLKKFRAGVRKCRPFKKAKGDLTISGHSFRSLTELKAKGIHLKPSLTQSLCDVRFKSNFMYAELQLPTLSMRLDTKTLFLNIICYELDPQNITLMYIPTSSFGVMTSYINLMKSLIVKPEDVKELREKKILLGLQGSDEEIIKMYQDLNTHEADNPAIYEDVKDGIQEHCNSKAKTWMTELIHTYIRSPWALITLLATTCLLVLTILQTVYTMKF
ncbi:hypothetical protein CDL12_10937 [Handroanthus impetiginosus]|uniref:Uncharacterized protein n=1 Tax=Handroanthus impetiginosus TaxID=429701 RepID=A0A2G9HGJ1_9LAMI|nr:hypothetical protein CDL12_10937 [Handroanthus impetiginosus]